MCTVCGCGTASIAEEKVGEHTRSRTIRWRMVITITITRAERSISERVWQVWIFLA